MSPFVSARKRNIGFTDFVRHLDKRGTFGDKITLKDVHELARIKHPQNEYGFVSIKSGKTILTKGGESSGRMAPLFFPRKTREFHYHSGMEEGAAMPSGTDLINLLSGPKISAVISWHGITLYAVTDIASKSFDEIFNSMYYMSKFSKYLGLGLAFLSPVLFSTGLDPSFSDAIGYSVSGSLFFLFGDHYERKLTNNCDYFRAFLNNLSLREYKILQERKHFKLYTWDTILNSFSLSEDFRSVLGKLEDRSELKQFSRYELWELTSR